VYRVALRDDIRDWVLVQGRSQRSAAKQFDVSRDTVAKLLQEPPEERERRYRRQQPHPAPMRDQIQPHLERWLAEKGFLELVAHCAGVALDGSSHVNILWLGWSNRQLVQPSFSELC